MALDDNEVHEFDADLERLEWKYIQTNSDIVKNIHVKQTEYQNEITGLEQRFEAPNAEYIWWSDLLNEDHDDRQLDQLIRKIVIDIKDQYKIKNIE